MWGGRFAERTAASVEAFSASIHYDSRLYRQDIADLITRVRPGTPVRIIDEPLKKWVQGSVLYLEVHSSIENPAELGLPLGNWNIETVMQTLREARGIPVTIPPLR